MLGVVKDAESVKGSWARAKFRQQESIEMVYLVVGTKGRERRLAAAVDDGLNAFHCSFRGSTLSLPAPPLQVTPPRKSVAIHPVIPLSLPPPLTPLYPPTAPRPAHSFNPSSHRADQSLCCTHADTQQVFVAKVTLQGNGCHLRRVSRCHKHCDASDLNVPVSKWKNNSCVCLVFKAFVKYVFKSFGRNHTLDKIVEMSNVWEKKKQLYFRSVATVTVLCVAMLMPSLFEAK